MRSKICVRRIARWLGLVFLASTVVVRIAAAAESPLTKLAAAKFPNLTRAERALLEFAEVGNLNRGPVPAARVVWRPGVGEFAIAGPSADLNDPANDPENAGNWPKDRDIRASLIRWLSSDPEATRLVDQAGISVIGARIVGGLTLDAIHVPFPIQLVRCAISGRISLAGTRLRGLNLAGTSTDAIFAPGLVSEGNVNLDGAHVKGGVLMDNANVEGNLTLAGAKIGHSGEPIFPLFAAWNMAVRVAYSHVNGFVAMCCGFEANGAVEFDNSVVGADFSLFGGRFVNPGNIAIQVEADNIAGDVIAGDVALSSQQPSPWSTEFNGVVRFINDAIGSSVFFDRTIFDGAKGEEHGLSMLNTSIKGALFLQGIELRNEATLDLSGSSAQDFIDSERNWPAPGKLKIDRFSYGHLGAPNDADARLRWLRLQEGFQPQPYRQLAKYLRESGNDAGAIKVLVAEEDLRYSGFGIVGRVWGSFLKWTVGYGHRPLLAFVWMVAVVVVGWALVLVGKRAGVMRLTWPETTQPPTGVPSAGLNPLLYSLDVFLPFVNLHQEHYWWPDERVSGTLRVAGRELSVRGSTLRVYLWLQIIAGWLLSAIFIAGVTGLLRND